MIAILAFLSSIEGSYNISGQETGPDKKTVSYTGSAKIEQHEGNIYHIHWNFVTTDGKKSEDFGTGLKTDKTLSVMFKTPPDAAEQYEGVQVYKIQEDTLEGPFVLFDATVTGREKLEKIK